MTENEVFDACIKKAKRLARKHMMNSKLIRQDLTHEEFNLAVMLFGKELDKDAQD